ncbi:hypothetical protein SPSIL_041260 [Sporomusa silvacetica DSM 10669]|uniref:Uncharacterized protein n=1 Tax=Sporomusa silvacetica DSM 10669 TaxID=1123289 RepID=A0ABZ3IQA3_9FIRM|nr:hypothetical protein [Sporomusa silvacetica]OZC20388.1 hypothetical protein SPSIL_12550 [Sporomusa silvacetica DSM 10669]
MNLLYGVYPNAITITTDPKHPIVNQLSLDISFPDESVQPGFVNSQRLTPDDDLPGLNAVEYNLSRIYIWFPWETDTEKGFVSAAESVNIAVSPGPNNANWYCARKSDANVGTYWILFPKVSGQLVTSDSIQFVLDQIISTARIGQSYMFVKNCNITGYTDGIQEVAVLKQAQDFEIISFTAQPSVVVKGRSVLVSWEVENADFCTLDPGNQLVALQGNQKFIIDSATAFSLSAQRGTQQIRQDVAAYLSPPVVQLFTTNVPGPIDYGTRVTLQWDVLYAETVIID